MIITGALPWWNELPEDLDRCIRGLANIADRVVAVDGSYSRYPGATVHSPDEQVETIRQTCRDVGLECRIIQPDRLWRGQVEKRTFLLAEASKNTDWIATVDTDHIIHTDREGARREIANRSGSPSVDIFDVDFHTPDNPERNINESAPGMWHIEQRGTTWRLGHLWRALPEMKVENFHWYYSAVKDGEPVWLWGNNYSDGRRHLDHHQLGANYSIEHRCLFRTTEQILASRAFLNDRAMVVSLTGQEDDYDHLSRPEWDYVRMPE